MTTIEGNKLIAEFMGILYGLKLNATDPVTEESKVRIHEYNGIEGTEGLHINHLKFHSSWDWLMPVVEKIHNEGFHTYIGVENTMIGHNGTLPFVGKNKDIVISVWDAVIQLKKTDFVCIGVVILKPIPYI